MSFFTDLVLADKTEAKKVATTANPAEHWPGVSFKSMTCLDFAALYGIFLNKTGDDEVVDLEDEFTELPSPIDSIELRLLPKPFIEQLANVDPKKARAIAKAWQAAEVAVSEWTLAEVQAALTTLGEFAQQAKKAKKPIMLCISGF